MTEEDIKFREFLKKLYNEQSLYRKLRNIYLGYKFRIQDFFRK